MFSADLLLIPVYAIFFTAVAGGFAICLSILVGQWKGAPYIPSTRAKVKHMLALARLSPSECAVDLGSGNGVLVCAAALTGARAVGIEFNPFLVALSRLRVWQLGLSSRARVVQQDFKSYHLGEADVVFLYLWPSTVASLREKLTKELKPAARVVSNGFEVPGWTPAEQRNGVYLYEMSKILD